MDGEHTRWRRDRDASQETAMEPPGYGWEHGVPHDVRAQVGRTAMEPPVVGGSTDIPRVKVAALVAAAMEPTSCGWERLRSICSPMHQ